MSPPLKNWSTPSVIPKLINKSCHIWQLDLNTLNLQYNAATDRECLSIEEQERSEKFLQNKDKQQFIAIRTILRQLLGAYTRSSAKDLEIRFNNLGKPFLKNTDTRTALYFNITHARGLALLAFCHSAEVGIDIEYTERSANFQKLAQRFFSPQENIELATINNDQYPIHFFRLWTRKEAFVKAVGTGLGFPLSAFTINTDPASSPTITNIEPSKYSGPCYLRDIETPRHYLSTIACLTDSIDCELYHWPLTSK